jgi:hypothetical protein
MTDLTLSRPIGPKKEPYRKPLSQQIELGVGAFLFVCISIICLLSLLFLSHNNRVATKGYELKVLQAQRSELMRTNEVLSMQIADLQSLEAMESDSVIKNMIPAERPRYIRTDTAVAVKQNEAPES